MILDHLFDQTSDIVLSQEHHGPPGRRNFDYEPTCIIRGLQRLQIELKRK